MRIAADASLRTRHSTSRVPELLAPAGDWECARAAVENGADAIYFGLEKFNARMRAHNFTESDLPRLMEFLHRRGVKGYVTFNTLVFANEMAEAERSLRAIIAAGVDAAIVQDIGICRLIRQLSPDFPIHASTQMTISSAGGIRFARELGCALVVLARECSLKEIERIHAAAESGAGASRTAHHESRITHHASLPLEVFVHGALCVAYSGQCLTSEALGGRSANRGECAQACRMPYELISDGHAVPLGDKRYLLSPQDLAGLEVLPELIRAGVASLKIEGRLKSAEYVANITRVYRKELDRLAHASTDALNHEGVKCNPSRDAQTSYEMEMAFSRGLHTGWFRGINNQQLVHARFGKKRGVYLGAVTRVHTERVFLKPEAPLKPGDGVVFDSGHPEQKEEGGRIYQLRSAECGVRISEPGTRHRPAGGVSQAEESSGGSPCRQEAASASRDVELRFGRGSIDFSRIHVGDKVWKTDDPELDRRLRQSFAGDAPQYRRPVEWEVHGRAGQPLVLLLQDGMGHVVQVRSAMPLAEAESQPLTTERLRQPLGRLGGTPFKLGKLENHLEGGVMLPVSELNRLRREAVSQLETLRARPKRWTLNPCGGECESAAVLRGARRNDAESPALSRDAAPCEAELAVLVRTLPQLEAALRCGVETLYCEFEDPRSYREAVARFRAWPGRSDPRTGGPLERQSEIGSWKSQIFVAPPRIFKTGEDWILKQVRSCDADGYLVRNYDHLEFFDDCRRLGDFSLNVANPLTAEYFVRRFGLERVTASYDLNITQLEALLRCAPPEWFEITIHQHMPMFHMEHCVFCAFLSNGTDYTNCGRPCDRHDVKLRDRVGAEHPLKADAGCRNTVFNARAQTGAEYVSRLLVLGARRFRIEFLNEPPEQVVGTMVKYRQLLRGEITGTQLWRELRLLNQLGVTRGPMGA